MLFSFTGVALYNKVRIWDQCVPSLWHSAYTIDIASVIDLLALTQILLICQIYFQINLFGPVPTNDKQIPLPPSVFIPLSWKMRNVLKRMKKQFSDFCDFYFLRYSRSKFLELFAFFSSSKMRNVLKRFLHLILRFMVNRFLRTWFINTNRLYPS